MFASKKSRTLLAFRLTIALVRSLSIYFSSISILKVCESSRMSESREEVGDRQHVELELSRSKADLKAAYAALLSMNSYGAASDFINMNPSPIAL